MPAPCSALPTIVCPLAFERRAIERCGLLAARADLRCCGPGPEAVCRWVEAEKAAAGRTVILAGLAGGVAPEAAAGTAWVIDEVVDDAGAFRARPTWPGPSMESGSGRRVASVARPVTEPAMKQRMGRRAGAALVDLESVAFAAAAAAARWRWGIVRGVSDGVGSALPPTIGDWIDADGRSRPRALLGALARRPVALAALVRLRRDGVRAMTEVAALIERFLSRDGAPGT